MTGPSSLTALTADHLDAAAQLLADRQQRLRVTRPELPERFADPAANRRLLDELFRQEGAHGVAAVMDGRLVAFLLGYRRTEEIWGRACWSPIEGQAYDAGVGAELMADVYAAWSRHWVERGIFRHYLLVPANDPELLEMWFGLNFGKMQAHAVMEIGDRARRGGPEQLEVRRATPDDARLIEPLAPLIAIELIGSPAYAITLPEQFTGFWAEYEAELRDPQAHLWLAIAGGRALGLAGFYAAEPGPMVPAGAWVLGVAMTVPDVRGRGVQRALLDAGLTEARAAGAGHCITDWRTANLVASRTWPRLGFRPTHFRLHRHVDERVVWADERHALAPGLHS